MNQFKETITPEKAAHFLNSNASFQRKLRDSVVDKYARDMRNGEWKLTHQGIAFDTEGRLIDGQHRLAAIVKACVPVTMSLVTNVPINAYDHVDLGVARSAVDIFKAQGSSWITNEWVSCARFLEVGTNRTAFTCGRSPFEAKAMVEKHKNSLHFVFQNMARRVKGITIAPVLAAVAAAYYYEKDRVKLADFIRLLVSGVANDPTNDDVVIRLRENLRDNMGESNSAVRLAIYLKTQRVIKAYMHGERLKRILTPNEPCYPVIQDASPS